MNKHIYKPGRRGLDSKIPVLIRKNIQIPEPDNVRIEELVRITNLSFAEHIRRAVSIYLNGCQKNRTTDEEAEERCTGPDLGDWDRKVSRALGRPI